MVAERRDRAGSIDPDRAYSITTQRPRIPVQFKSSSFIALVLAAPLCAGTAGDSASATSPPMEWIDAATGHRVVRLSTEAGTRSLYFHQNSLTPDGRFVVVEAPGGIATIDLSSRANKVIVPGK